MKIIGSTPDGFIVQATGDELAQIIGFDSLAAAGTKLAVGDEIRLAALWKALSAVRTQQDRIGLVASRLRERADEIDEIRQTLASPAATVSVTG